jgi:acyl-CoA synthetase (AMP-forming)/AMP-acid ligase II
VALADPPNRENFMHGSPHRLNYADADRIVSAIAARLRDLGLPTDAVVGIQLHNTVECAVTILGVLRAGMIAAPLPFLWRRAEMTQALGRLGAKAIITASSVADVLRCVVHAMQAAAEIFPIRCVCGFGQYLPDGVIPFDELLTRQPGELPEVERDGDPAAHVAVVTVEITPNGPIMVARSHMELLAGGLGTLLEGDVQRDARLLGCCGMSSFAGLALTLVPWLLAGGTLSLHHGFDAPAFAAQCRDERSDTVVAPAPLVPRLAEAWRIPS